MADRLSPEIWCRRPLESQTGQVNGSIREQVENSDQTCYCVEVACEHHTLTDKHTKRLRTPIPSLNSKCFTHTEATLTCARPQVYNTATQGFPELDVTAAGANGKPVWDASLLGVSSGLTVRTIRSQVKLYQRGGPGRERGEYETLRS